jgi:UDP-glucuronate decarboxylase
MREVGGIGVLYNLACIASPPRYKEKSLETIRTSTVGVVNMLELAKQYDCPVFQASTSEVYGDPERHPQSEDYWGNVNTMGPRSCYDESKRLAETCCYEYHRLFGVQVKVGRIFNTYGPYMDPADGRVVSNFINQALRGEDLTVYGDGSHTRSFQYINDLLAGIGALMDSDKDFIGPVNLGNPGEFTVLELAERVLSLVPNSGSQVVHLPEDVGDPKVRRPDICLAREKLGWEPRIGLGEGLKKTVAYFGERSKK